MVLTVKSAVSFTIADLAALFTRAFTGYIGGTMAFDAEALASFVTRENVDLTASRVLMRDEDAIGIGFIARQGWTSRVAAMGIVPAAQEKGLGGWFMQTLISEARARGDQSVVLEAYEQNERAVRLYKRVGFTVVRRLPGYSAENLPSVSDPGLKEIDIYEVAKVVMQFGSPDLPWQVSGTAIARWVAPNRAYQLDEAYAVISDPSQGEVRLRALVVPPSFRGQHQATRLLQALAAEHPNKRWIVQPVCPEEYGITFLENRNFVRKSLNQVQMELRVWLV